MVFHSLNPLGFVFEFAALAILANNAELRMHSLHNFNLLFW